MSHNIICVCNIISIKMCHYYLECILEISYENKLLYTVLYLIITTNKAIQYYMVNHQGCIYTLSGFREGGKSPLLYTSGFTSSKTQWGIIHFHIECKCMQKLLFNLNIILPLKCFKHYLCESELINYENYLFINFIFFKFKIRQYS